MNLFSGLKNLMRPKIVDEVPKELVRASIRDIHKLETIRVADYPKGEYFVYWENYVTEVPGGFTAAVRFYSYSDAPRQVAEEVTMTEPSLEILMPRIGTYLKATMETFKR